MDQQLTNTQAVEEDLLHDDKTLGSKGDNPDTTIIEIKFQDKGLLEWSFWSEVYTTRKPLRTTDFNLKLISD